MAKRSLILTSTSNQGKKLQKTITDINPNAGAEALKGFAQKLNAMTTNTYVQTDCIDKFNVDTEIPPVDTRQTPTFTLSNDIVVTQQAGVTGATPYTTNSDGEVSVAVNGSHNVLMCIGFDSPGVPAILHRAYHSQTAGTFTVRITGTETYKPFEQTYEYTIGQ